MANNKSEVKISVIMLTFNREYLVEKAIQSIRNQTFQNFEFIIVDNGSTDKSGSIAEAYLGLDNRIRVIHRDRGTIGSGRNTGLNAAQGDYITFIDDDDWCEPDYLEFLYRLAIDYKAEISICGVYKEENGRTTPVGIQNEIYSMNAEESIIQLMWRKRYNTGFPTKLILRRLFDGIRFNETGQYEDISLMYKILARANLVISHGQPKYHVYRHDGNNSSITTKDDSITPEYLSSYRTAYRERTIWLCQKFPVNKSYWWYFDWSFQLSMVNKIVLNHLAGCDNHLKEMQNELRYNYTNFYQSPYIHDFEKLRLEKYVRCTELQKP